MSPPEVPLPGAAGRSREGSGSLPEAERLLDALAATVRAELAPDTALVGIHTGGVWVAQRLQEVLHIAQPIGTIDVAFYRDDYKNKGLAPGVRPSDIPFKVEGADIILVDDVLYTGRTIRAALNEIFDYGRPARVRLAALVDRGERQLPICPQFVGGHIHVGPGESIELRRDARGRFDLALMPRPM